MQAIVKLQLILLVGLLLFVGCGADDSPDGLTQQIIDEMNKMADAVEANESEERLEAIRKRVDLIREKMKGITPTQDQKDSIEKKYKTAMESAQRRYIEAMSDFGIEEMKKRMNE